MTSRKISTAPVRPPSGRGSHEAVVILPVDDGSARASGPGSLPACLSRPSAPLSSAGVSSAARGRSQAGVLTHDAAAELAPGGGCAGTSTPTPTLPVTIGSRSGGVGLMPPAAPASAGGRRPSSSGACRASRTARRPGGGPRPAGVRWAGGRPARQRRRPYCPAGRLVVGDAAGSAATGRVRTAVDLIRAGQLSTTAVVTARPAGARRHRRSGRRPGRRRRRYRAAGGAARARAVAGLADGLAESPPETRLRLLLRARRAAAPVRPVPRVRRRRASSPGSTSPTPSSGSRSSTTARGTANGRAVRAGPAAAEPAHGGRLARPAS